jgi:hypothetical protein
MAYIVSVLCNQTLFQALTKRHNLKDKINAKPDYLLYEAPLRNLHQA